MANHYRAPTRRNDDSMIPLLTVLVVIAAAGPALFTALTQWLVPRLTTGRDAVSLSLVEWLSTNWWLVVFWVLELVILLTFLAWSRRRRTRRMRQLDSVVTGLARVLPADWQPGRDLRVLRWNGHRPVRLQLQLTPRSPLNDPSWRQSVVDAAGTVLGPLGPVAWPQPSRNGVFDWGGRRPPRIELRVSTSSAGPDDGPAASESKLSANSGTMMSHRLEDLQIYRRPRPESATRVPADQGSAPTRLDRED